LAGNTSRRDSTNWRLAADHHHEVGPAFSAEGDQVADQRVFERRIGGVRRLDGDLVNSTGSPKTRRSSDLKEAERALYGAKSLPNDCRMHPFQRSSVVAHPAARPPCRHSATDAQATSTPHARHPARRCETSSSSWQQSRHCPAGILPHSQRIVQR